jgi:dCTP deaminase
MSNGILCDNEISRLCQEQEMIVPYEPALVREQDGLKVISYGLSSYGYDMRVADEFLIFSNATCRLVDPKNIDHAAFVRVKAHECVIPPNSFALAYSVERFKIPDDVLGIVLGKSTYARVGIVVNVTPLEPGWEGHVTIEISNTTPVPVKVYADEGIAQVLFLRGQPCKTTYAKRAGKYNNQGPEVVLPKA